MHHPIHSKCIWSMAESVCCLCDGVALVLNHFCRKFCIPGHFFLSLSTLMHVLSIQPNTFAQTILNKENLLVSRLCFFLFINMEKVCHCTRFASPSNANPTRERLVFFSVSISKHYIPRRKRRVGGGSERVESKFITNLFCTCVSVSERERENK